MKLKEKIPQGYLSYSQISLWNSSPKSYRKRYILGHKIETPAMKFGKEVADYLENPDGTWDILDEIRIVTPYPEREKGIFVKMDGIKLIGYFDGFNKDDKEMADYKVSINKWTQKDADRNEQLTLYSLFCYLKYGWIPESKIHWLEAEKFIDENGLNYSLTGGLKTFKTKRSLKDLGKMKSKVIRTYEEIKEFYQKEKIKMI